MFLKTFKNGNKFKCPSTSSICISSSFVFQVRFMIKNVSTLSNQHLHHSFVLLVCFFLIFNGILFCIPFHFILKAVAESGKPEIVTVYRKRSLQSSRCKL